MSLKLYNSYAKKLQPFKIKKVVTMYNCGPTVYDYVHIGNLRSFLFTDVLRRYLEYRGAKVKQVMNITDVGHMTTDADAGEDKMSLAMKRENKGPKEVARFFEEKFFEDLTVLGVKPAFKYPRATEHVPEMIKIIKQLIKNKKAYFVPNSGVYYDLSRFKKYGQLSGNKVEDLLAGARVDVIQEKKNPYDFALWIVNPDHILKWPSPWGVGYPGWHVECSAMSMKYLGKTIDIHTGGEDNKFPHHECEIAQSEGATGKKFVRFWLHVKHLLVDGKKMSKSLNNFFTLRDLLEKGYSPRSLRYLLISSNYRESFNFTLKGLEDAQKSLERIDEFVSKGVGMKNKLTDRYRQEFIKAMDDNLNVSKALGVLFDYIREMNRQKINDVSLIKEIDQVLGLGIDFNKKDIPVEVQKLAESREKARVAKDWKLADKLRDQLKNEGYVVEDKIGGFVLKKL